MSNTDAYEEFPVRIYNVYKRVHNEKYNTYVLSIITGVAKLTIEITITCHKNNEIF